MELPTLHSGPIACSLSVADLRQREEVWSSLASTVLRSKVALPDGVRLVFESDHALAHRLVDLVVAERECCGWASWTLDYGTDATVIEVRAVGPAAKAVRLMFETA